MQPLDLGTDPPTFVSLICSAIDLNELARACLGIEALRLATCIMRNHRIGSLEDVACRAIVLLELDHHGVGIVLAEGQDVADVRPAPRIDGLVVVTNHHQIAVTRRQEVGDPVLRVVGVLVLVHADLAESLLVAMQHVLVL